MDFNNKFVVAECFDQDGSIFIEAAPGTWIRGIFLHWPRSQRNLRLRSVLKAPINLDEEGEWTKSVIKSIKGLFDSFPDACKAAASLVCYEDTEEEQQNKMAMSKKCTKNEKTGNVPLDERSVAQYFMDLLKREGKCKDASNTKAVKVETD